MTSINTFWILVTATLSIVVGSPAIAKPGSQERSHSLVNPGKIDGYGPFLFSMDASKAFKAASSYKSYESYEGFQSKKMWVLKDFGSGRTIIVHFRDDESISQIKVVLNYYTRGLIPRGECYTKEFASFSEEFLGIFPDLLYVDVDDKSEGGAIQGKSKIIPFSNGSKIVLKVYNINGSCYGDVWVTPPRH